MPAIITTSVLVACGVNQAQAELFCQPINDAMDAFGINQGANRAAMFLGQILHESQALARQRENLNYSSASRIYEVFCPKGRVAQPYHVTSLQMAQSLVRNPERLANHVYATRYGNGNAASGDGFKYRGGGLMGLTFSDNYKACGDAIGYDLANHPELIETPLVSALSAAWFWNNRKLNELADSTGSIVRITEKINGGRNGLDDRIALTGKALAAINKENIK